MYSPSNPVKFNFNLKVLPHHRGEEQLHGWGATGPRVDSREQQDRDIMH